MDIQSFVIYGGLLIIIIVLAWIAQKENRKELLLLAALCMALIAGIRATSVGIDTAQYTEQFRLLKLGRFDLVYAMEKSFMYLCSFLMKIFRDAHFLFTIFALLTHGLVMLRLWDFKDKIILSWAVACYYIMFFPESLNVMRQMVAIAIVFYGTRYISKKKYMLFFLFIGIAFFFHNSALIGLGFILVDVFFGWRSLAKEKKVKIIKGAAIVIIAVIAIVAVLIFKANIIARYQKYFTNIRFNFGLMLFAKFIFLLGTIVLMHNEMVKTGKCKEGKIYIRQIQSVRFYYGLGIVITSLGYVLQNANRIGWYYGIVECVYFGIIVKEKKYRRLFQLGVALVLLYTFFHKLIGGSNGEIPYLFFWQA